MTKKKRKIIIPSPEEDAIINAGIADDPDTFELDAEWFANAKPTAEVLPHILERYHRAKHEQKSATGEPVSVKIDADIAEHFRNSGAGWERRLNQALRQTVFGNASSEV